MKFPPSRLPKSQCPPYRGSFFGQTFVSNGCVQSKMIKFEHRDKITGDTEWRRKRLVSIPKIRVIWNGVEWMGEEEFNNAIKSISKKLRKRK